MFAERPTCTSPGRHRLGGGTLSSLIAAGLVATPALSATPPTFDLRNVNGTNFMTSVKNQDGYGTCWCHGTMAAIESNLKVTGRWLAAGETDEPNLAEYHLDWWNGFNQYNNDDRDPPAGGGLEVHNGGDYRVATAYLTRGEGAVFCPAANDGSQYDWPWLSPAPARSSSDYHLYYPRHIEWYTLGEGTQSIETIKAAIMQNGAIGTCMYWLCNWTNDTAYQPPSDGNAPNHSIVIAGWDDNRVTPAPTNGAWLCKNSWGSGWCEGGYFWISYYDKQCCRHPQMGAVSFRDVVLNTYDHIYYHDYHGWRDTMSASLAFNAFQALTNEQLAAVSFYTTTDGVAYTVSVFDDFDGSRVQGLRSGQTGWVERTGFHTVDLNAPVDLRPGQTFYIALEFSAGGQAFDRTSTVDTLMNPKGTKARSASKAAEPSAPEGGMPYDAAFFRTMGKVAAIQGIEVVSRAAGGESYYWSRGQWVDLTNFNSTANFCIKGLTWNRSLIAAMRAVPPATQLDVTSVSSGRTYRVQSATDLVTPAWSNEMTFVATQTTATVSSAPGAAALKFFRVAR